MKSTIFKYPYETLLIVLILFHLTGNLVWIFLNQAPPAWDPSGHTLTSLKFVDYFIGESTQHLLRITDYYPPFVHLVVTFFMMLFNPSLKIAPIIITLFFILGIIFLYLYTKEISKDSRAALLAAVIFSFLPKFYDLSRNFLLDVPLITLTLASLYFLEKSQRFEIKKYTIFFSLSVGAALLTKWTAAVFIFIPVLLLFLKRVKLKKLIFPVFLVGIIILPWYLANAQDLVRNAAINLTPEASDPTPGLNMNNLVYYLQMLVNFQLTWLGLVLFILSVFICLKLKNFKLIHQFISFCFIYIVFTIIGNKDIRYTLFLPVIASIFIAFFLSWLISKFKMGAVVLTSLIFFYYIFYYFSLSFGIPLNPQKINIGGSIYLPPVGWVDYLNLRKESSLFLAAKFNKEIWPHKQLLKDIYAESKGGPVNILVLSEKEKFNPENLKVFRNVLDYSNLNIIAPYSMPAFDNEKTLQKYLDFFQYIAVTEKDFGPEGSIRYKDVLVQLRNYILNSSFQIFEEIKLPDGDRLIVYEAET